MVAAVGPFWTVHSNRRYNCMYYTLLFGHCFILKMSNISSYSYLIDPDEMHYIMKYGCYLNDSFDLY